MRELIQKAKRVANSNSPILVYGETGTGKELLVQAAHNYSMRRRQKPFVAQNCAVLPKSLWLPLARKCEGIKVYNREYHELYWRRYYKLNGSTLCQWRLFLGALRGEKSLELRQWFSASRRSLRQFQKKLIKKAITKANGSYTKAARLLKIPRKMLF